MATAFKVVAAVPRDGKRGVPAGTMAMMRSTGFVRVSESRFWITYRIFRTFRIAGFL